MAISISLIPDQKCELREPLIFGALMDDIEATAEKLRFAISNAKSDDVSTLLSILNEPNFLSSFFFRSAEAYANSKCLQQNTKSLFHVFGI